MRLRDFWSKLAAIGQISFLMALPDKGVNMDWNMNFGNPKIAPAWRFEAQTESDNEMKDKILFSDSFWASKRRLSIFGPRTLPKRHRRQNVVKTSWQMNALLAT